MLVILLLSKLNIDRKLTPWLIGATVAILIICIAPFTQAGFNPARDFGPRTMAYLMGWNPIAYSNAFWLYTIGPLIGAAGAVLILKAKD